MGESAGSWFVPLREKEHDAIKAEKPILYCVAFYQIQR